MAAASTERVKLMRRRRKVRKDEAERLAGRMAVDGLITSEHFPTDPPGTRRLTYRLNDDQLASLKDFCGERRISESDFWREIDRAVARIIVKQK